MKIIIIIVFLSMCGFNISYAQEQECGIIVKAIQKSLRDTTFKQINLFYKFVPFSNPEKNQLKNILPKYLHQALPSFYQEIEYADTGKVTCVCDQWKYMSRAQVDSISERYHYSLRDSSLSYVQLASRFSSLFVSKPIIIGSYALIKCNVFFSYMNSTTRIFLFKKTKGKFILVNAIYNSAT